MHSFKLAQYVEYKGDFYLVVDIADDYSSIVILRDSNDSKRRVSPKSLSLTKFRNAIVVTHQRRKYIVTLNGLIISLTSQKVMQWPANHGTRIAIITEAMHSHNTALKMERMRKAA